MKLKDEQFNAIVAKLAEKAGRFKCPVCGQNEKLNFSDTEFHILAGNFDSETKELSLGGQSDFLRVIAITCPKCAHISFFNLVNLEKKIIENE